MRKLTLFEARQIAAGLSLPVVSTLIEIGRYPTVVKSLYGRGAWPHHNFIFPLDPVFTMLDIKMMNAYRMMGSDLAISRYLSERLH